MQCSWWLHNGFITMWTSEQPPSGVGQGLLTMNISKFNLYQLKSVWGGGLKLNRIFIKMIWMWICCLMDSYTHYIGMGICISLVCHSDMWWGDNVYCILFCRGLVIAIFSPILRHTGYGLSWQEGMVMTWGGLRGAVGLALALQVAHHDEIDSETVGIRVSRRPIFTACVV